MDWLWSCLCSSGVPLLLLLALVGPAGPFDSGPERTLTITDEGREATALSFSLSIPSSSSFAGGLVLGGVSFSEVDSDAFLELLALERVLISFSSSVEYL